MTAICLKCFGQAINIFHRMDLPLTGIGNGFCKWNVDRDFVRLVYLHTCFQRMRYTFFPVHLSAFHSGQKHIRHARCNHNRSAGIRYYFYTDLWHLWPLLPAIQILFFQSLMQPPHTFYQKKYSDETLFHRMFRNKYYGPLQRDIEDRAFVIRARLLCL